MQCCRTAASVLLLALVASSAEAAWHRLDSPNFVVVGDASPRQLRDVAIRFEMFREVLARLRGSDMATAPVPTVILVFRSPKAFEPYSPQFADKRAMAGVFVPGRDVNHIAFVNDDNVHPMRVMYHEYGHLLNANALGRIPTWLNEGLAELYSSFETKSDGREAAIGRALREHHALLTRERLLKVRDLVQVDYDSPLYDERERRSVFYAQSWVLVHMLYLGEPSRAAKLALYRQRLLEGKASADAWADAFAGDDIDRALRRYVQRGVYRWVGYKFPERIARLDAAVATPLAPADVQTYLAQFQLRRGKTDDAAEHLASGAKLDPHNETVRVVSAHIDLARGEYGQAAQRLRDARVPADWLAAYYGAVALSEALARNSDVSAELVAAAAPWFDAVTRERRFPNTDVRRAGLELQSPSRPADETVAAVQRARDAAPGREDYTFVHARLLARRSEFSAARTVLGPLLSTAHEPRVREAARSLMGWIVTIELQRTSATRASATTGAAADGAPAASNASDTSLPAASEVVAVFRKVKEEEERVDGILQNIECRGASAVFVLETSDATLRLAAPRMEQVEFITYREDVTGSVSCGALKQPMRAYVTSGPPSKPGGPRHVVAVEFLPKDMQ